jgi:Tol biopolymer transport system component
MNGVLSRIACVSAFNFLAATAGAAWMSSPMSWAPDSRWLCYTVSTNPGDIGPKPGWLLDGGATAVALPGAANPGARRDLASSPIYRIWAAHQNGHSTVLIEESRWPLSAPAWNPRGRSVAFSRFVPESGVPQGGSALGRLEIVIQRGLDQKEVVWTSPDFVLDETASAAFPYHHCSWSPDGQILAVPRVGREPAIDLISIDKKQRLHVLDHATLPVWAPDGSMCAYIRRRVGNNSLEVVKRRGRTFSEPRELLSTGPVTAAPFWSPDGQSILVVSERTTTRSREFELTRCPLGAGQPIRVLNLVADPTRRVAKLRGITIDYDHDAEFSFHAVDLENRDSEVVMSNLREPQTHKRFHVVDPSLRIGAVSVSPDGRCVAARFGDPDALSHPALFSAETESTVLLVPDETSRQEWLRMLTTTAMRLLRGALPPIVVDGHAIDRASLLPLPGEFVGLGNVGVRLGRIADLGSALLPARDAPPGADGVPPRGSSSDAEARLLFNYLRGELKDAAADLSVLDLETTDLENRLSLLGLRAQILWAQGEQDKAKAIIAYLVANTGTATQRLEETPLGPVVTKVTSPLQAWAGFLSLRAAEAPALAPRVDGNGDPFDIQAGAMQRRLLEIPEFPLFEPGGAAGGPFAPLPRDLDRLVRPN